MNISLEILNYIKIDVLNQQQEKQPTLNGISGVEKKRNHTRGKTYT